MGNLCRRMLYPQKQAESLELSPLDMVWMCPSEPFCKPTAHTYYAEVVSLPPAITRIFMA